MHFKQLVKLRSTRPGCARATLLLAGFLASCIMQQDYATGPMEVSYFVKAGYEKYLSGPKPGTFAISKDGLIYGYSYCPYNGCRPGERSLALNICRQNMRKGQECIVYAAYGKPIFSGDQVFLPSNVGTLKIAGADMTIQVSTRNNYEEWTRKPGAAAYAVTEDGAFSSWSTCTDEKCWQEAKTDAVWRCQVRYATACVLYGWRGNRASAG